MTREELLDKAKACVCGDRQDDYGTPEKNFTTIAMMWNMYMHNKYGFSGITPKDVAELMVLLKISRECSGHGKTDNLVDIAGYAACAAELDND